MTMSRIMTILRNIGRQFQSFPRLTLIRCIVFYISLNGPSQPYLWYWTTVPAFPKINDLTLEQHLRRVRIYVDTYWGKQCNIIKAHCVKKDWNLYCVCNCITIKIILVFMQLTFNWWWMLDNWHVGNISLVWLFWASFCVLADLILPLFSPVTCNFSQTPFNLKFK